MSNNEIARMITYIAGFALGVFAVAAAIYIIIVAPERTEIFGILVTLGLALMGQGGIATANIPSLKVNKGSAIEPVPAVVSSSVLNERVDTGSIEAVPVDPIEMTSNPDSPRRGEPGVVYNPDAPGKYGRHE